MDLFPDQIDDWDSSAVRNFKDFDDRYTAPIHGFKDAEDYWQKSSSRPYIGCIRTPTLLVNALNDPYLAPECYPYEDARGSECFFLETPSFGGHVGFVSFSNNGEYWSESRSIEFFQMH